LIPAGLVVPKARQFECANMSMQAALIRARIRVATQIAMHIAKQGAMHIAMQGAGSTSVDRRSKTVARARAMGDANAEVEDGTSFDCWVRIMPGRGAASASMEDSNSMVPRGDGSLSSFIRCNYYSI
jgi:hypothetical protein